MGTRKPTGTTGIETSAEEGQPSSTGREKILRSAILNQLKAVEDVSDFDELIDLAQKIAVRLFLNQASICLNIQSGYMNRDRPLQDIESFRILNITSDIMRELTAYDFAVDTNKAIEYLTRQGYEVSDGSQPTQID